jgi:hypothetical protein
VIGSYGEVSRVGAKWRSTTGPDWNRCWPATSCCENAHQLRIHIDRNANGKYPHCRKKDGDRAAWPHLSKSGPSRGLDGTGLLSAQARDGDRSRTPNLASDHGKSRSRPLWTCMSLSRRDLSDMPYMSGWINHFEA